VLEVELTVDVALDLGPGDPDLEIVPLTRRRRRIAYSFASTLLELPQHEIVFELVRAESQIVTVRHEVEQDSYSLVDAAGNALEAH
jgi:hypothetical protein